MRANSLFQLISTIPSAFNPRFPVNPPRRSEVASDRSSTSTLVKIRRVPLSFANEAGLFTSPFRTVYSPVRQHPVHRSTAVKNASACKSLNGASLRAFLFYKLQPRPTIFLIFSARFDRSCRYRIRDIP